MFADVIVWFDVTSVPRSEERRVGKEGRSLIVTDTRMKYSTSLNWKSDAANVLAVSSFVVTLLADATGTSFTALTLMVMVAASARHRSSFVWSCDLERAEPLAFDAGA